MFESILWFYVFEILVMSFWGLAWFYGCHVLKSSLFLDGRAISGKARLWRSVEVSQQVCHTKQFKSRLPDPSHEKNLKSLNKRKFLFFHFVSMFVIPLRVQLFKGYRQCRQPLTFCLVYTSHFAPNSYLYIPRCCMFFAVSWKKPISIPRLPNHLLRRLQEAFWGQIPAEKAKHHLESSPNTKQQSEKLPNVTFGMRKKAAKN